MDSLFTIEHLSISFRKNRKPNTVVRDFNLSLQPGEIVGIVGESGSGKSVSMMTATRLIENAHIDEGSITLNINGNEINLAQANEQELQGIRGSEIAYIFQEPMTALHPLYTCGEQVVETLVWNQKMPRNEAVQKCLSLFEEMRLPNPERVSSSYPHQLSGGQRQRVMIAMALANNPSILIADEPTTALDSVLQKSLTQNMVESCKQRNTGLILISHDVQLIKDFTDKLIVMYKGEVVETGNTANIIQNPKSVYTRSLLDCQPHFRKRSQLLPTIHELADYVDGEFIPKPFDAKHFTFAPIEESPYIEIRNLTKTFTKGSTVTTAVNDVSFVIRKGETLGLIGESGCGKSTVSKMIIQLLEPDSGTILFGGKPASSKRRAFAKKVQMIFQDPYSSLNPAMKAGQIVEEPIAVHKLAGSKKQLRAKVEDLLVEVGLQASDYDKYPHEFSGGQRQRISIARALAVEPDLIICDESVSALDVSVQAQILNLFNQLKVSRQLTYLFISHDLNVVSYICDRILVMKNGMLVEEGNTEKLVTQPENPYTRKLLQHT